MQKSELDKNPAAKINIVKTVMSNPINLLAFGFGSGLAPKAPGTFGTIVAVPLYLLLLDLNLTSYLIVCSVISLAGIYICGYCAKSLDTHDHPGIVWDEIAGFLITMISISFSWLNLLLGFILFRIFDIFKPWPINWIDKKVSGGFGIMLDDILAGIFAMLSLHAILYFLGG